MQNLEQRLETLIADHQAANATNIEQLETSSQFW